MYLVDRPKQAPLRPNQYSFALSKRGSQDGAAKLHRSSSCRRVVVVNCLDFLITTTAQRHDEAKRKERFAAAYASGLVYRVTRRFAWSLARWLTPTMAQVDLLVFNLEISQWSDWSACWGCS
jgi:hypothetical protein